jgi:hypothetical protein
MLDIKPIPPSDPNHPIFMVVERQKQSFMSRAEDDPNAFLIMIFAAILGGAAIAQGVLLYRHYFIKPGNVANDMHQF